MNSSTGKVSAASPRPKVHTYYDEQGRKVFERVRFYTPEGKKMVTYRHSIGRGWALGLEHDPVPIKEKPEGADRYLYRLPALLNELVRGPNGEVWWTEGESDADALWVYEEVCATSHHQAAGNASAEQAEWFRGFRGWVILCMDLDEDTPTGGNVGAKDVIVRLDLLAELGVRALIVMPAVGKDIRDHLEAGLGLDEVVLAEEWFIAELREKAAKTTAGSLCAYREDPRDAEIAEMIERGWKVRVAQAPPAWATDPEEVVAREQRRRLNSWGVRKVSRTGWLFSG